MDNVPRSKEFDDVYFSVHDGLTETRHVFLDGNDLRQRWSSGEVGNFTICETGFGTGLNFLAALNLWREVGAKGRLAFISFEKFPVTREFIQQHLSHWNEVSDELGVLLSNYPVELKNGIHTLDVADDVRLILIFGDVNEEIGKQKTQIDCWFLDGFKPSSNPEMWSETVFQNMGRLSREGATFATFTSAGFVRRGLKAAGFDVRKVAGFGRKREMSVGYYGASSCA